MKELALHNQDKIFNNMPLPVILVDNKCDVLYANCLALDLFNLNSKNIYLKNLISIFKDIDIGLLLLKKELTLNYTDFNGLINNLTLKYNDYDEEGISGIIYILKSESSTLNSFEINQKSVKNINKLVFFYETFINDIKEGICVFNSFGRLIYSNSKSKDFFQKKNGVKKYFFWDFFEYFNSKSDWEEVKKRIDECVEDVFLHEYKDENEIKTFSITLSLKKINEEKYYLLIFNDISNKIKKRIQIQSNEKELNLINKNIPVAAFEFVIEENKQNYFTHLSDSFGNIFPFNIPINDKKWYNKIKFHPEDFRVLLRELATIREDIKNFNFIGRFTVKENTIWFKVNSNVIKNGDKLVLNGVFKNISLNKKLQDDIDELKKFNELILSNIPADIALFDESHNYLFINKKGIENNDLRTWLLGKNDYDYCHLKGIDSKFADERRAYFNQAKKTKNEVDWVDEFKKDGKTKYIYRRFYPLYINDEFKHMIGYGIDITELRQSQNQISAQNVILSEKNKELERFAYVASHDLQEPLLSIISFSKLLEEEYSEKLDENGNQYIDLINKSALRMRALVNGLMEYSRIDNKEISSVVNLNNMMRDIMDDLSFTIKNHNAIININDLPSILCYPTFMRILIQNLISNAIKFTPINTIPTITISCKEKEDSWQFKVEDNGIGISPDKNEDIFLLFKRLHNQQDYQGHGIGLAHCKKIAKIHGGNIWVKSNENNGSTFYFTISKKI